MEFEDVSGNTQIASMTKLVQALSQCRTPFETLQTIRRGLAEAKGPTASMMLSTRGLPEGEYRLLQLHLEGHSPSDGADPWLPGHFPLYRGGVVAAIIGEPQPRLIHAIDWAGDPIFRDALAGYGSVMAIPFASDRLPMTWVILLKRGPARFSTAELEEAVLRVALIGSLLESQTLAGELARANERIDRDVRHVAELQRALLPCPLPQIQGLELAVSYEPSGRAGGDWYDFFPLDESAGADGRWCVFMGDASGHGLAAAVVMAMVQSILHVPPPEVRGPADLLEHANRHLCRKDLHGFVTAFLGIYDPAGRRLTYASAGHPPPLFQTPADASLYRLDVAGSYPLGIDSANTFKEACVRLRPGDRFLLYTDGITEARGAAGEMFEPERLDAAFRACNRGPEGTIKHLRDVVCSFQQGKRPLDDQTLVAAMSV